jgi:hypothetical protein
LIYTTVDAVGDREEMRERGCRTRCVFREIVPASQRHRVFGEGLREERLRFVFAKDAALQAQTAR